MRIAYPIVIDNDYAIWSAFNNNYWPALYFVDNAGRVRDHHFGEGEDERSERVIQRLVGEAGAAGIGAGVRCRAGSKLQPTGATCVRQRLTSATRGATISHLLESPSWTGRRYAAP